MVLRSLGEAEAAIKVLNGKEIPPQTDRVFSVDGFPEVFRYNSFKHDTYIASNGAIEIRVIVTGAVDFTKAGANGKGVWE